MHIKELLKNQRNTPRFETVFTEWLDFKVTLDGLSRRSYDRYLSDYSRFFHPNFHFMQIPFSKITPEDLEFFIRRSIVDNSLTNKAYSKIRLILRGVFKFAYKKGYTKLHIDVCLEDMNLSERIFSKSIHEDEKEVFTQEEETMIIRYIDSHPADLTGQGIKLLFLTGMRIGELAVLTFDDVHEQYISVSKTETSYKERDEDGNVLRIKYEIKPFPKTEAGIRSIIIPSEVHKIVQTIQTISPANEGNFLFYGRSERMHGAVFSQRLRNICKSLGIQPRSAHKIRKTYSTKLINSGLEKSIIIKQMGHTDFSTTDKFYYYNNLKKEEMVNRITRALDGTSAE